VWAAAAAYNSANRQPRQHWGPMDAGTATKADWALWERDLEARLA